jgi:hypothetical protein
MDKSLKGLMRINRFKYFKHIDTNLVIVQPNPVITTPSIPNNTTTSSTYKSSDFGENVINNHSPHDAWHSERVQFLFNYVTRNFRNRCTSIQSYNNILLGNSMVNPQKVLEYSSNMDADMIITAYVNAGAGYESEYYDFVLPVGAHYDNRGTDGNYNNDDRHDITPNANTFLINSVAVGSRRDTPSEFMGSTSYGYGMEFFEDCSPEGLDGDFPDKDIDTAFAEFISTDGVTLTSSAHPLFANSLTVGEMITIRYSGDESDWVSTYVTAINSTNSVSVSPSVPVIPNGGIYGWHKTTFGAYQYGQAQSWATPIVAGKLKVIKMTTNKDWDTVRNAARLTARRNPTGIPEIDNANWDMYRGFGKIDVQSAIDYINSHSL